MLTTVAALVIVLGLMVSLARDVRSRSADRTTKDLLRQLDRLMARYYTSNNQSLPLTARLIDDPDPAESAIRQRAFANNRQFVHAMIRQDGLAKDDLGSLPLLNVGIEPAGELQPNEDKEFNLMILDAWGGPIAFMPSQHPAIGMAPSDRFFFFSAGPDGRFLTRQDNLYSYDSSLQTPFSTTQVSNP